MGIPALPITNSSVLGKMLVESAIFFQASAAEIVGAEGEKLQFLTKAASNGKITPTALIEANGDVKDTICCLAGLENAILAKIAAGTSLICHGFCPNDLG